MSNWPFADPENTMSVSVRQVMQKEKPILLVCRDSEDGTWQFLTGGPFAAPDALLVQLKNVVALDPTVMELANLPLGWQASRTTVQGAWQRSPMPKEEA